jgi:serine O-acetyltransferase
MDESWKQIVTDVVASYDNLGGLNNEGVHNMPSKRAVGQICEDLLRILFPGFHDDDAIHDHSIFDLTEERLATVVKRLETQVRKSVRIGDPHRPTGRTKPILFKFCKDLPEIRELLHTDIQTAYEGDPAALSREEIILSYPCIEAISIQRLAHRLYQSEVPIIPRMMTEWAHGRTGIDIHPGAKIGSHFFIDHGTGVVIGETCAIGARVRIYQGVTLGARGFPSDDDGVPLKGLPRHPLVEDDVVIYAGATILGRIRIGKGATIGGNVWLTRDVAPGARVTQAQVRHHTFEHGSGI